MIASITLLAEAFHEASRALTIGVRQRLRVVAARLMEDGEDPGVMFPQDKPLEGTLISLAIDDHSDALRLLVCRQPRAAGGAQTVALTSNAIAGLMANAIAMKIIAWTGSAVGFTPRPLSALTWPAVLAQAAEDMTLPAPGFGVVVAEIGDGESRCPVIAVLLGDQQADIAQWVPTTTIRGV